MEHGEFRGNLYGTSVQSVADLAAAGYQPILNPHFQVPIQRAVFRIRIHRIHMFFGLLNPDPDPLVRGMDPEVIYRKTFLK
jgi:hypothetical protein